MEENTYMYEEDGWVEVPLNEQEPSIKRHKANDESDGQVMFDYDSMKPVIGHKNESGTIVEPAKGGYYYDSVGGSKQSTFSRVWVTDQGSVVQSSAATVPFGSKGMPHVRSAYPESSDDEESSSSSEDEDDDDDDTDDISSTDISDTDLAPQPSQRKRSKRKAKLIPEVIESLDVLKNEDSDVEDLLGPEEPPPPPKETYLDHAPDEGDAPPLDEGEAPPEQAKRQTGTCLEIKTDRDRKSIFRQNFIDHCASRKSGMKQLHTVERELDRQSKAIAKRNATMRRDVELVTGRNKVLTEAVQRLREYIEQTRPKVDAAAAEQK